MGIVLLLSNRLWHMNNENCVYLSSEIFSSVFCDNTDTFFPHRMHHLWLLTHRSRGDFFPFPLNLIWIQFCPIHLETSTSCSILFAQKKTIFGNLRMKPKKSFHDVQKMVQNFTISTIITKMEKLFLNYQQTHRICQMQKLQMCAFRSILFLFALSFRLMSKVASHN